MPNIKKKKKKKTKAGRGEWHCAPRLRVLRSKPAFLRYGTMPIYAGEAKILNDG